MYTWACDLVVDFINDENESIFTAGGYQFELSDIGWPSTWDTDTVGTYTDYKIIEPNCARY